MAPPASGPMVGPMMAGMETYAIAVTRSLRGKLRSRISRPTGVIMAPPMPCSTRLATSMAGWARRRSRSSRR